MPQRSVATNFTFEQQRQEINLLAADFWTQKGTVDTAASTYLKHDGTNAFTGQSLAVPNAFTINANSGNGTLTISGNLDVTGTTTTVSSANLEVTDKNILIAKGSTSDAQADGAGITIDSATDITFNFVDNKDALVSSIGLEGTTFLKAPYGQFTGSGTATGGQGVEINAPDTNTGQIISYDRANTAYKELRVKGSSVGIYGGTSNALSGTFNNTGLIMELGKSIGIGDATGSQSLIIKAADPRILLTETTNNSNCYLDYAAGGVLEISVDDNNVDTNSKFQVRIDGAAAGLILDSTGLTTTGANPILELQGTASTTGNTFLHINANANHWCVGADNYSSQNNFVIKSGTPASSDHRFLINGSGNVGIGSTNPLKRLHLMDTGDVGIMLQTTAAVDNNESWEITCGANASNNADLVFQTRANDGTGGNVGMRICHDGEVLIGTSTKNASDRFTIIDPGNAFMSIRSDAIAVGTYQILDFATGTNDRASANMTGSIAAEIMQASPLKSDLCFSTNKGNSISQSLKLRSSGTLESFVPDDDTPNFKFRSDDVNWHGYLNQTVAGASISTSLSCGGSWVGNGTTYTATKDLNGSFETNALFIHNQYNNGAGGFVFLNKAAGSTTTDGAVSELLRIKSSGNVGINVNDPQAKLHVNDTNPVIAEFYRSDGSTNDEARIAIGAKSGNIPSQRGVLLTAVNTGAGHHFKISTSPSASLGPTEKLRIRSDGTLVVGGDFDTNAAAGSIHLKNAFLRLQAANQLPGDFSQEVGIEWSQEAGSDVQVGKIVMRRTGWAGAPHSMDFYSRDSSNNVTRNMTIDHDGGIYFQNLLGNASSGSAVKYSNADDELRYDTSSKLLKTNIVELTKYGIDTVKNLKPCSFTPQEYDNDGTITVGNETLIGFIADEMVTEVPEVVQMYQKKTLTKQEADTEVVPAAISYDKLTVVLTKALQEAIAKIETLETKVAALESA